MPTKRPRPWLVPDEERKGPQGRPRSGPEGVAVRELARITVRARARTLAFWDALRESERLSPYELFERLINSYLAQMAPERQNALMRDMKRRRRDDYRDDP